MGAHRHALGLADPTPDGAFGRGLRATAAVPWAPRCHLKIAFVGDVLLGRLVNAELRTMRPPYPWGDTLPVLRRAGTRIANLECVLADDGRSWPAGTFHFRSGGKNVASVKAANLSMVPLANNHVLDFGDAALLEMLSTLARNSIRLAGVVAPGDDD